MPDDITIDILERGIVSTLERKGKGMNTRAWRYGLFAVGLCLTAGLIFYIPNAAASEELVKLTASDGTALGHFGNHVAVSGDTAVVGAPHPHVHVGAGAAYVFTRVGDTWIEQAKLTASDAAARDRFGWSVAISGDTIVVSALWDDVGINEDQGSAYVFTKNAGKWTEQAKLTASDGVPLDQFGFSVAVSGDDVIVGAKSLGEEFGVPPQGSAYVFARAGGTWTEQVKLTPSDGVVGNGFGFRVGLDGDTAVVGAVSDNGDRGSAYVFTRTGGTWTQQKKLTASDGEPGDEFGFWVSVAGDTVVVGDPSDNGQGSAYVFTRTGGDWTEQKILIASDGAQGDYFGRSVAVSGDTVVVGAQGKGSAYVFERTGGTWSEKAHLTAADSGLFGISVGISGDTAVVGASFSNVGENPQQGAAYVWKNSAANRPDASSGSSASPGRSNEQPARSKPGPRTRPASPPATIPPSSASTDAGNQSGVGNPDDPSQGVEPRAVDEAMPVGAKAVKENDFLPIAALIALLLVTMAAGGFELKKRFGRTTT
ncbi:MAG: FG-GAP repeat protein [Actinobacteria bacterium]|nr:FG-GAP repeat protein [Actinomycetota bacterium]